MAKKVQSSLVRWIKQEVTVIPVFQQQEPNQKTKQASTRQRKSSK